MNKASTSTYPSPSIGLWIWLWAACAALAAIPAQGKAQSPLQDPARPSVQALFDEANSLLQAGNTVGALRQYHSLLDRQTVSGALYLNMGIAYVRLDSLGKAKYYFLKASRFEVTRLEADTGLNYVEERFSRQSAVLPKLPWDKAVDWLRINVGTPLIFGFGIILLNAGILAFISTWFIEPWNRPLRIGGMSTSLLALLIILCGFYVQYVDNRYNEAVMVHEQTSVMEKPAQNAPVVSKAYEGYTFTVDRYQSRDREGWSYVRMSNGLYGWIPTDKILIL